MKETIQTQEENVSGALGLPKFIRYSYNRYRYKIRIVFPVTIEMARVIKRLDPRKVLQLNCTMPAFDKVEIFYNKRRWNFATERRYDRLKTSIDNAETRAYKDKDHLKVFFREIEKLVLDEEIEQIERDALGCDYDVDLPY